MFRFRVKGIATDENGKEHETWLHLNVMQQGGRRLPDGRQVIECVVGDFDGDIGTFTVDSDRAEKP